MKTLRQRIEEILFPPQSLIKHDREWSNQVVDAILDEIKEKVPTDIILPSELGKDHKVNLMDYRDGWYECCIEFFKRLEEGK